MPMRSWLCAPALGPNLVKKSIEVAADIALFDLEDSVPADRKDAARAALLAHYQTRPALPTAVRINSLSTTDGLKDILFLLDHAIVPAAVMLPKAVLPCEANLAASLFKERGVASIQIFAIIETVSSLWSLRGLPGAPGGLRGLVFGAADFAADLGVPPTVTDLRFVKQEIALAARRFGLEAIDSPCFQLRGGGRLDLEICEARRLGFTGKIAVHPSQIAAINSSFTHSPQALDDARRLVDASEHDPETAIRRIEDEMVGPPFVKYARQVLASAEQGRRR